MCGIFCEMCGTIKHSVGLDDIVLNRIRNRGPDCVQDLVVKVCEEQCVHFFGTVLWMQGEIIIPQPVHNESGILLYNGDIFDNTWDKTVSDTTLIMEKLHQVDNLNSRKHHVLNVLKSLKGPFSIIYYDKATHDLFFTRDRIGRSSLLFHKNETSTIISSVLGRNYKCVEIPATFIHILNLDTNKIELHPWSNKPKEEYDLEDWLKIVETKQSLPDEEFTVESEHCEDLIDEENMIDFIQSVAIETQDKLLLMRNLLQNSTIYGTVTKLIKLLEESVKIRLETQPNKCKNCLNNSLKCSHCTVGVLFSGGLDCTILAFLANKYVHQDQPIDLINVAFRKDESSSYDVPDRITGRQSFEELKSLCSTREWVFREVDVPKEELEEKQRSNIADLIYPRQTILDESLGSALWFAARCQNNGEVSPCRVHAHLTALCTEMMLLLGSGADELFGGYSRHRNAFKYHGWSGLNKELMLDWNRISFRNLARDNRVICDHGRQPRMPYLDEDFTEFVLHLKPWLKCFPSEKLGSGVGDKLMLRLVAFKLGLIEVATFPKRALQFGSRIANKKEKGSDLSKNFTGL